MLGNVRFLLVTLQIYYMFQKKGESEESEQLVRIADQRYPMISSINAKVPSILAEDVPK